VIEKIGKPIQRRQNTVKKLYYLVRDWLKR